MVQQFIVIGLSDGREQHFPPSVLAQIQQGRVFSGGKRHFNIVRSLLPHDATWIDITVPIDQTIERYRDHEQVVVFASGDPLFFGFAATLQRTLPDAHITVFPYFHSLQMLAHRLVLPYHGMHIVSLTGRPWDALDEALIQREPLIGVLTDRKHTPITIAQRMLEYGYDNYEMYVGELLGNETEERVGRYSLAEAVTLCEVRHPNCVILKETHRRKKWHGIPDHELFLLNGRAKMLTKKPIRLLNLSMLDLVNRHTFWDVGFCTGSVSVEAKLSFPHLCIHAFEIRQEGEELMRENSRKFGALGITPHITDFMEADVSQLPRPDAVFIGGHGGKMLSFLQKIKTYLQPHGVIVFNAVSAESLQAFREGIEAIGMQITATTRITVDEHNPIEILKAE